MKPVSYHSVPSSVNGGHPSLALDRLLGTSKVMYCEKCGFASMDPAVFKKHVMEHMGTRFYCFYCNSVSYSEAELNAHLIQHTQTKYPFNCPHCGQGYMRRLCLVKHIDKLHSKSNSQGPAKPGTTKTPYVSVSGALPSVPTADPSPPRPLVRVKVPPPSASALRLSKDEQRGITLEREASNATKSNEELLTPLNGLIKRNRALTVSLPEEVSIPAGCLVELVEVKTVNGTKELKLRLVSQQENESVIKDTRTAVCHNTTLGKPLLSPLNHSNTVKSVSLGMPSVNRKPHEIKTVNVERPGVVSISMSKNLPNQINREKGALKRTSQEIYSDSLDCHATVLKKVPKSTLNPAREGSGGVKLAQREPVDFNAATSAVTLTRLLSSTSYPENKGVHVSKRAVEERKDVSPEPSQSSPLRRTSDVKSIPQDVSMAVKLEPGVNLTNTATPKVKTGMVGLNKPSLKTASPPIATAAQVRPPAVVVSKEKPLHVNSSFLIPKSLTQSLTLSQPSQPNHTNAKSTAMKQGVQTSERGRGGVLPQPESFPVISSVFSLSQQPEDVQGSIQPLVMALRGIVMDKSSSSGSTDQDGVNMSSKEHVKVEPTLGSLAQVSTPDEPFTSNNNLTETRQNTETIKEENDKSILDAAAQVTNQVKEEKEGATATDNTKQHQTTPDMKPLTNEESVSQTTCVDASVGTDALWQTAKSEHDLSKFLTVSLRRVQVGVKKKSKKGLKIRISKYKSQVSEGSATDRSVLHMMPLRVDQPVKWPSPNQPVVVLNHPKPWSSTQAARAGRAANTGAPRGAPKCQILKMRLSKVMGQKYQVMGCTVRVSP